jgi:acetylornithine aminotransferase
LCDETGTLLILDEIQTGMGRTGKLFAHEHYGIEPDIMTLAKALANGLPMGAMLAVSSVADAFGPGAHASTFGGTPIVCSAALAVFKTMDRDRVIDHGARMGAYFKEKLVALKARHGCIEDVRGQGLLLGMKINGDGAAVVQSCLERGFLINCVQDSILRFIPPLIIEEKEIDALVSCLDDIF